MPVRKNNRNNNFNNNTSLNVSNTQNDLFRVILDVNRHLNTIDRVTINTERKVNQIHTMMLSSINARNNNTNKPVLRRSARIKTRTNQGLTRNKKT